MLLLSALVHNVRTQRSQVDAPQNILGDTNGAPLAPNLAKILATDPKFMIELAIELTKLTQKEI